MFKIALIQMKGSFDKKESSEKAEKMIREAAFNGAELVVLPEMWNCPYASQYFREYAETCHGHTVSFMSGLAEELGINLVGGSIPELDDDLVYNTSFIFNREGKVVAKHRKTHLFDIDVPGRIRFMESETLTPGNGATLADLDLCRIGVGICYDVRFPEFFRKMALEGALLIVLPAAFSVPTGEAHWDITIRTRALDNQVYFAACSPARDLNGPYQAYGGSCVANPWGEFDAHAGLDEEIIYSDIDLDRVMAVREQLPLLKHRKPQFY